MSQDLITNVLTRQRHAERMLAVASFVNPAIALEQAGWLSPSIFWPLYLYNKGSTSGQGEEGAWFLVTPSGNATQE